MHHLSTSVNLINLYSSCIHHEIEDTLCYDIEYRYLHAKRFSTLIEMIGVKTNERGIYENQLYMYEEIRKIYESASDIFSISRLISYDEIVEIVEGRLMNLVNKYSNIKQYNYDNYNNTTIKDIDIELELLNILMARL